MKKKTYDVPTPCPYCGREFKSPQGMLGHVRLGFCPAASVGGAAATEASRAASGAATEPHPPRREPSVRELEDEVKKLELADRRQRLLNLQNRQHRVPDAAESAGMGPMTETVRSEIQGRAFGVPQRQEENIMMTLLKNPASLQTAVSALKGILGVNQGGGSDGVAKVLTEMGYSIRELIEAKHAPRAPSSLSIGGVSLEGMTLTPELISVLLQREDAYRGYLAQKENSDKLIEGLRSIMSEVKASGVLDRFRGGGSGGPMRAQSNADSPGEPEKEPALEELVCPECGQATRYNPTELQSGDIIECQNPNCEAGWFWEIKDKKQAEAEQKAARREREKRSAEAVTVSCPGCQQAIEVTDLPIGSQITCPICQEEFNIISQTEAVRPLINET